MVNSIGNTALRAAVKNELPAAETALAENRAQRAATGETSDAATAATEQQQQLQLLAGQPKTDRVEISEDATLQLQAAKENAKKTGSSLSAAERASLLQMAESSNEQAESFSESVESLSKCMLIAARIIAGDNVPKSDSSFLYENQPEMYLQAIMLRSQKEDAKNHKSLLEEESETDEAQGGEMQEISGEQEGVDASAESSGSKTTGGETSGGETSGGATTPGGTAQSVTSAQ